MLSFSGIELEVPVTTQSTTPPVTTLISTTQPSPSTPPPTTEPVTLPPTTQPPSPSTQAETPGPTEEPETSQPPTTSLNPPASVPSGVTAVNVPGTFGNVLVYWNVSVLEGEWPTLYFRPVLKLLILSL